MAFPNTASVAAPTPGVQDRFLYRYAVVTFVFVLWMSLINVLSDTSDDGALLFLLALLLPLGLLPLLLIIAYLIVAVVAGAVKRQPRRIVSALFGPIAGGAAAFVCFAAMAATGFTPDYFTFVERRSEYMSRITAAQGKENPPFAWVLHATSYSTTMVVYDPSRQLLLAPSRRSDDWVQRLEKNGFSSGPSHGEEFLHSESTADYRAHVTIQNIQGDFFILNLK